MTSPATPENPTSPDDAGGDGPPLRLDRPGQLIASLPALLGFVPRSSLVLVCLGGPSGNRIRSVVRRDLPRSSDAAARRLVCGWLAALCERDGIGAVVAVLVDDATPGMRVDCGAGQWVRGRHLPFVRELSGALGGIGTDLRGAYAVGEIICGAAWYGLGVSDESGAVADPRTSPLAAAQVLAGRVIHASREELEALLEPDQEERREALADEIDRIRDRRVVDRELAQTHTARVELERVLGHLSEHSGGRGLADHGEDELAELGVALSNPVVRDALFGLAIGPCSDAAQLLWCALARRLPDMERAEAATLLAFTAYVAGDGATAGVALDAALDADPTHRMASLLDQALRQGVRPEKIREIAQTGVECAERLGVDLAVGAMSASGGTGGV